MSPCCQEKPLVRKAVSVPQTDTGRWGEYSKAREWSPVKELGNLTPYLRKKRCPIPVERFALKGRQGSQRNGSGDCLIKTQDSAKPQGDV